MSEQVAINSRTRTQEMVASALIVALMAAAAWITVPLGAVPVTLQTFVVVLAALLLSPGWAAGALGLYLLLGASGLPIFSGAKGGAGVIAGPTGGYLIGFVVGAILGALVREALAKRTHEVVADIAAAVTVIVVIYTLGAIQLSVVAGMSLGAAVVAGVIPFIAIDAVKAGVAVALAGAIRRARASAGV